MLENVCFIDGTIDFLELDLHGSTEPHHFPWIMSLIVLCIKRTPQAQVNETDFELRVGI